MAVIYRYEVPNTSPVQYLELDALVNKALRVVSNGHTAVGFPTSSEIFVLPAAAAADMWAAVKAWLEAP